MVQHTARRFISNSSAHTKSKTLFSISAGMVDNDMLVVLAIAFDGVAEGPHSLSSIDQISQRRPAIEHSSHRPLDSLQQRSHPPQLVHDRCGVSVWSPGCRRSNPIIPVGDHDSDAGANMTATITIYMVTDVALHIRMGPDPKIRRDLLLSRDINCVGRLPVVESNAAYSAGWSTYHYRDSVCCSMGPQGSIGCIRRRCFVITNDYKALQGRG